MTDGAAARVGAQQSLNGLRGWLVLVGIGLAITIPVLAYRVYEAAVPFANGTAALLRDPASAAYIPGFSAILRFEMLTLGLSAVVAVYCMALFFMKSPFFPTAYTALLVALALFSVWDFAWISVAASDDSTMKDVLDEHARELRAQLPGSLLSALLWATYMQKSRRVAATFREESVALSLAASTAHASAERSTQRRDTFLYLAGAFLLGALTAVASGVSVTDPGTLGEWVGRASGGPLLGPIVGGMKWLFTPTRVPRWMFWLTAVVLGASLAT